MLRPLPAHHHKNQTVQESGQPSVSRQLFGIGTAEEHGLRSLQRAQVGWVSRRGHPTCIDPARFTFSRQLLKYFQTTEILLIEWL